ncbi:MAG: lipoyl domain-containing protein [Planctomycetota bacterium]|jgi:pyruvate dehydrogenase E2 component (dihydrolipoamide acetyltransferase)|nr:lipoyl domain-containing protein [Planctomycetota bacterium]
MAALDVNLPELGEDAGDEARVSFWYVDAGEEVEEGDDLVQMLTDKATFDVPSPAAGKVVALVAEEDQAVKVGELLCRLETKG